MRKPWPELEALRNDEPEDTGLVAQHEGVHLAQEVTVGLKREGTVSHHPHLAQVAAVGQARLARQRHRAAPQGRAYGRHGEADPEVAEGDGRQDPLQGGLGGDVEGRGPRKV